MKKYEALKPIAASGISNCISIEIYDIIYGIDDYIVSGFNGEDRRKTKIFEDNKGSYFKRYGIKYYLSDFMRL